MSTPIAMASDHAGYHLKEDLIVFLEKRGVQVLDFGTDSTVPVDYPDSANSLSEAILAGKAEVGVLICGSGIGVSIVANRHKGIRAAVCHDVTSARLARRHNDANVLALGARLIGSEVARECLEAFLETDFEGGRHAARVEKMG